MENLDIDGLAKLAPYYPISAELPDLHKHSYGIFHPLHEGFNLTKAVDKYGMEWLKP